MEAKTGDAAARPERLSQKLVSIVAGHPGARMSIDDLLTCMQDRAHGALLILFAIPNTLPGIPGTSAVLGVPLVYLTLQQALGRKPWLPGFIANRSVGRDGLLRVMERAQPWLERGERYLHPRLGWLTRPWCERLIGLLSIGLALTIMLPVPFGNMMPALAIIFFSLGLMERDGMWVLLGAATAVAAVSLVGTVVWALLKSAAFILAGAFGLV